MVVLPLLPEGPYGPAPGIRPRALWLLVLLFSGLSFAGFVGRRLAGRAAYPVTGLLGGLVSSTSVTLTFARLSRTDDRNSSALAAGAVAACTILFVRVAVAITVLNRGLLAAVSWYLMPPFLVGVLALLVGWRAAPASSDEPAVLNNPLQFRAAIEMAALFQLVLFAVDFARRYLGTGGLLATGFVLGLTDVDALTISMARSAATGTSAQIAARAIALGILANTLVKLGIALTVGRRRFTGHAGIPLVVMAAILWALIAA